MDNNIDNKGYWENQAVVQNNKEVNDSELIALLREEFGNMSKTLEEIRDGVNDIKEYAKTRDINKLTDSSKTIDFPVKEENKEDIEMPQPSNEAVKDVEKANDENIVPLVLPPVDEIENANEEVKAVEEPKQEEAKEETIIPIGDILQNNASTDSQVIDNNDSLEKTEQISVINPDTLNINNGVEKSASEQVETPAVAETVAPAVEEAPVMPVAENPVQVETPTVAETVAPTVEEAPVMPVAENPVQVETPAVAETVAPAVKEAPVIPVAENPVQVETPAVAETVAPAVEETPVMPVAETIDTIEVIPLTFDSAKIAPIDPSLKSAQRTEILTENQNAILKGKSISNTNVMTLQPAAPEIVKAA